MKEKDFDFYVERIRFWKDIYRELSHTGNKRMFTNFAISKENFKKYKVGLKLSDFKYVDNNGKRYYLIPFDMDWRIREEIDDAFEPLHDDYIRGKLTEQQLDELIGEHIPWFGWGLKELLKEED